METHHQPQHLHIMYVTAECFPQGIEAAFKKLEGLIGGHGNREFFGLSKPEEGSIVYRAGVSQLYSNEAAKYGCETCRLPEGNYLAITVHDFMNNVPAVGSAFKKLLDTNLFDPAAWCIERYTGNDVVCMVKMKDQLNG